MMEKQKLHLSAQGGPKRILFPIRLHELIVTNPSSETVYFSLTDASPQVPDSLEMPFIVAPVRTEVFPMLGAKFPHGLQMHIDKGHLDVLLVFEPDKSDFEPSQMGRAQVNPVERVLVEEVERNKRDELRPENADIERLLDDEDPNLTRPIIPWKSRNPKNL